MFTFHRYAQANSELKNNVSFHPCQYEVDKVANIDLSRLLRVISYVQCFGYDNFSNTVGNFLNSINLSHAILEGASFFNTNFIEADLSLTEFNGANLIESDFISADCHEAQFNGACLIKSCLADAYLVEANFTGACLDEVDLSNANLSNANLSGVSLLGANLSEANLSGAILNNIFTDTKTIWVNARGLNKAFHTPAILDNNPKFRGAVLLGEGCDLVVDGNVDAAFAAYKTAKLIDPDMQISAYFWNQLGRFGCLYNRANDVLFACEKAVESQKSATHQNTRGLARALTGNLTGAIEDFEAAINSGELEGEMLEKRQRWLEALKSGINPFTPEELEALRASEGATS